jgi:hypothetical protein
VPGPFVFQMSSPPRRHRPIRRDVQADRTQEWHNVFRGRHGGRFRGNESACSTAVAAAARSSFIVSPGGPMNFGGVAPWRIRRQTFTVQNHNRWDRFRGPCRFPHLQRRSGSPFNLVGLNATQTVTVRFRPTTVMTATANVDITAAATRSQTASGTGTRRGDARDESDPANRAAPQSPGSTITFTATATGGTAPINSSGGCLTGRAWAIARDWSTSSTFAWTPSAPTPTLRRRLGAERR